MLWCSLKWSPRGNSKSTYKIGFYKETLIFVFGFDHYPNLFWTYELTSNKYQVISMQSVVCFGLLKIKRIEQGPETKNPTTFYTYYVY